MSRQYSSCELGLPKIKGLCERTKEEKAEAHRADKESHAILKLLRRDNKTCADCEAPNPGWAALPHGVFICIECAQVHRSLGRHISQVKSFSTGTYLWYEDEIDCMRQMGNRRANNLYLQNYSLTTQLHTTLDLQDRNAVAVFIRNKYVTLRWIGRFAQQQQCRTLSLNGSVNRGFQTGIELPENKFKGNKVGHPNKKIHGFGDSSATNLEETLPKVESEECNSLSFRNHTKIKSLLHVGETSHEERCKRILAAYDSSEFFAQFGISKGPYY
mmetsp:Transcript_1610/g.3741  ORF Transcript_1610/g.3741 Transcript_1610/m.3741 type:complete len:272 (+) Transcript_1610:276-1091(+)